MKFEAKIWKTGNSYVITVPKFLIKSKSIILNKEYSLSIVEVKDEI